MKQVLFNKIKVEELQVGDHIYTWRYGYSYAHHGIYVGDRKVIHFTKVAVQEAGTETSTNRVSFSSSLISQCSSGGGDHPRNGGVLSSSLECFLSGGKLRRFRYGVSPVVFHAQVRGTCTIADTDSPEEVLHRAETLLNNGFGTYNLFKNNCEDFAIYCKTGYNLYFKTGANGVSGQAASFIAAAIGAVYPVTSLTAGSLGAALLTAAVKAPVSPALMSIPAAARASVYLIMSTAATVNLPAVMLMSITTFGLIGVFSGGMAYCSSRYHSDIGVRKDVKKIPVEELVNAIAQ